MKIPVNLKILFVTVVALAVTISYLIKQSIIIQQQDKINLAYQSQLNETVLLGDKFLSLINNGLNSLKQIAALDWQKPETPLTSSSILKNQNEIKRIYLVEIPLNPDMDINPLYKSSNEFGDAEQKLVNHWVISKIDDLSKNNPVIVNLSGDQGQALVGIIIPDLNYDVENKKNTSFSGNIKHL